MGSALGADPGDPADQMEPIVAGVRAAGVRVASEGTLPMDLPPAVAEAALRIVQEGLTNAAKHAPGARVRVRLGREGDALGVAVEDGGDGRAASPGLGGSGLGLAGLAEAAAALGGWLAAGPVPTGGWAVRAELPLAVAAPDPAAAEEGHPGG